ncbi:MAG: 2-amino-4-hydroxy-6-hydroxymethyldihydropteridine diphosphokinase [Aliidiomarina sp.]|uniref:2-amino-4-hydroxy-6- hydroxymethyldihydropteridine diphosphokinase n=1 Tax=Aliidiomarina sp. TaxID=1872439 RepID=UPI0025C4C11B|nr:2-amino-4-hydroxy-6-hydroxymethyldihydropteridine diphosphokinase [Aliidiomarina sp.]MCH8502387.1 2-amino-4-hydroxy-6-hydroxymethyldihydropteridine diphosphokinase [Aliidiomarina sp.]
MVHRCFIGLGANLEQPLITVQRAAEVLARHPALHNWRCSSLYQSKPMGPQDQPDYVNAVACFDTELQPLDLLDTLQSIEQQFGRLRGRRWGPRTLDLDLLFYANENINHERLTVPHPGILEREFVLIPLAELAPDLLLPTGQTAAVAAQQIPLNDLCKVV